MQLSLSGILAAIIVLYLGLLIAMFLGQRSFLYHPDTNIEAPARYGVPQMHILVDDDQDGLTHWYGAPSKDSFPVIVLFHGNAGHVGYRAFKAKFFLEQGYGVLLAGYRGYGANSGSPTEQGLYEDARSALKALSLMDVDHNIIALYGESLGTGIAVQMALEGYGDALILEASYSSMVDVAFHHYPVFPISLLLKDQFNSAEKIDQIKLPKLFIHGQQDTIIPIKIGKRLYSKAAEPKQWHQIAAAGHNDLYEHGAAGEILKFLMAQK